MDRALPGSPVVRARVQERLADLGLGPGGPPRVWINAGGREGSAKVPTSGHWVRLVSALAQERSLRVGLLYGPGEVERVAAVEAGLAGHGIRATPLWPAAAADLHELLELCRAADLMLTSDTGPRHVSLAAGSRTYTLFGSSDPRHTEAERSNERVWRTSATCAPCGRERCGLPAERQLTCFTDEPLEPQVAQLVEWLGER